MMLSSLFLLRGIYGKHVDISMTKLVIEKMIINYYIHSTINGYQLGCKVKMIQADS